jgi:hypothetical protein
MKGESMTGPESPKLRLLAPIGSFATGTALGGVLGAATNAINGRVSPEYFRAILRWPEAVDVPRAALAQGIFEGLIYGTILSLVFTVVATIATRCRGTYRDILTPLVAAFGGALAGWLIAGVIAICLAQLSTDFYRHAFYRVPEDASGMLRYAWVGGSIWGVEFGGVIAVIISATLFSIRWRAMRTPADPA